MAYVTVDWSTVEVRAADGDSGDDRFDVVAHLEGAPDEPWRRAFNALLGQLVDRDPPGSPEEDWTIAPVAGEYISVAGVRPGQEAAVKDELEMMMDRANAHVGAPHEGESTQGPPSSDRAELMARRFQGE